MKKAFDIKPWILEVNHQYIAVNKPAGIPVQQDPTGDPSLLEMVSEYARQPLYLINRIDRPVSGVVLFARKKSSAASLNRQFSERKVKKRYLAVTESGRKGEEELVHWIKKLPGSARVILCEPGEKGSLECHLPVKWVAETDNYSLCIVEPTTGFTHQIRAQLSFSGCPVKGDVKYGARRGNKDRSIHLHAWELSFLHPVTGEEQCIRAQPPGDALWDLFTEKGIINE
jgi:23S rRNA pseudouridine1911/1915/1917 synthase